MPLSSAAIFELARRSLRTTQVGLGAMLGVSRRTAQRWAGGGIPGYYLPELVRLVHPHDPRLAAQIAAQMGTTLESLGIAPPEPSPAAAGAHVPAALAAASPERVVDCIVCAAAEAMDLGPRTVRAGLLAAFARARELQLPVDLVERVLRESVAPAAAPREATGR